MSSEASMAAALGLTGAAAGAASVAMRTWWVEVVVSAVAILKVVETGVVGLRGRKRRSKKEDGVWKVRESSRRKNKWSSFFLYFFKVHNQSSIPRREGRVSPLRG